MINKVYDSFFKATQEVFKLMLDVSATESCSIAKNESKDELSISIDIVGELTGKVLYRFPKNTSLKIVNVMSGMEVETVDDFVISAISEISNIISGNALTLLEGKELKCDILPPQLVNGSLEKGYSLNTSHCISTTAGDVNIEIYLNSAK